MTLSPSSWPGSFNGGTITDRLALSPGVAYGGYLLSVDASGDPANGGVGIQAPNGATDNMLEVNTFVGDVPFQVDPNGYLVIATNAAPADGALSAGEMAIWFDKTNGAAKLMVKAKQTDGTVKTAAVALA